MILEFFVMRWQVVVRFIVSIQDVQGIFGAYLFRTNGKSYYRFKKLNNTLWPDFFIRAEHFGQGLFKQNGGYTAIGWQMEVVLIIIFHRDLIIDDNFKRFLLRPP